MYVCMCGICAIFDILDICGICRIFDTCDTCYTCLTFTYNYQREQFLLPTLGLASTGMSKGGKMSLGSGGRGPFLTLSRLR